jgi:hypothetical protein
MKLREYVTISKVDFQKNYSAGRFVYSSYAVFFRSKLNRWHLN